MRKLKITKCLNAKSDIGIDELNENLYQCIVTSNELPFNIAHVFGTNPNECERNSDLVANAINTANKCDMLPSELLELLINVYCSINQYGNISDSQKEILEKLYYNE